MPIARDTSGKASSTGTTATLSLTLGVNAKILIADVTLRNTDFVTGCTWDGVAMTELATHSPKSFVRGLTTFTIHRYIMLNPTTGTHDLVATASSNPGGDDLDLYGSSYTESAGFTIEVDNANSATGNSGTNSVSITPVAGSVWTSMFGSNEESALVASTGSNLLQSQHGSGVFDSNGAVSGATTMNATHSSGPWASIIVSLKSVAVASPLVGIERTPIRGVMRGVMRP